MFPARLENRTCKRNEEMVEDNWHFCCVVRQRHFFRFTLNLTTGRTATRAAKISSMVSLIYGIHSQYFQYGDERLKSA
jgi:hypothetical protein